MVPSVFNVKMFNNIVDEYKLKPKDTVISQEDVDDESLDTKKSKSALADYKIQDIDVYNEVFMKEV